LQETILRLLDSHSALAFLGAFGAGSITAVAPCSLVSVPLLVGSAIALNKDLEGRKKVLYTYAFKVLVNRNEDLVSIIAVLRDVTQKMLGFRCKN